MGEKYYPVNEKLLQNILNYLQEKPFKEVAALISEIITATKEPKALDDSAK